MPSSRYNPFTKSLFEFEPEELGVLRGIDEGWFVDYKSTPLSARDFGKHISAFANQFGGWLFVGVAEGVNKSLKADSFPGIRSDEVNRTLTIMRDGVSSHISPTVYYEYRVIEGPVAEIGLCAGRSIVAITVPEGANPPYVHSSGRIYRRIGDSSDPKPETDRAVLDVMWRKSQDLSNRLQEFVMKPVSPNLGHPCAHIYFLEDLSFSSPGYNLSLADFREAMTSVTQRSFASMPLDNTFATQDGFIGRHHFSNHPLHELTSLRWWSSGNVRITMPLSCIDSPRRRHIDDPILERFLECMGPHRRNYGSVLNLDHWALGLFAMIDRYLNVRDMLDATTPIVGKIIFNNVVSVVPFIGMESYLANVKKHGIPVVQDTTCMFPSGDASEFAVLNDQEAPNDLERTFGLGLGLFTNGLRSLGVMFDIDPSDTEIFGRQLLESLQRALRASNPIQT